MPMPVTFDRRKIQEILDSDDEYPVHSDSDDDICSDVEDDIFPWLANFNKIKTFRSKENPLQILESGTALQENTEVVDTGILLQRNVNLLKAVKPYIDNKTFTWYISFLKFKDMQKVHCRYLRPCLYTDDQFRRQTINLS